VAPFVAIFIYVLKKHPEAPSLDVVHAIKSAIAMTIVGVVTAACAWKYGGLVMLDAWGLAALVTFGGYYALIRY
jgi:hypothetical protein